MSVRILFAMGRDNNLPGGSRLASVSGTRRVPVFPAVLVGVIALLILAFNIYNQYAFEVIIALGIVYMYIAYLGVNIPLLRNRLNGWPNNLPTANRGLFSLGRFAILTNVLAVLYGAAMTVNLVWPRKEFYGHEVVSGTTARSPAWWSPIGAGLILYYGYQKNKMGVLPEHQASAVGDSMADVGASPDPRRPVI